MWPVIDVILNMWTFKGQPQTEARLTDTALLSLGPVNVESVNLEFVWITQHTKRHCRWFLFAVASAGNPFFEILGP